MPSLPPTDAAAPRARLSAHDRRAAIVAATVPLLVEHGARVTTRQIADAAGVAEGTLFRVFDDKNALLLAAVAEALDPEPVAEALAALNTDGPLDEVLHVVVDTLVARTAGIRGVMAVAHEMRRAAGGRAAALAASTMTDADRPGSLAHAVHELKSRGGLAPARITTALTATLAARADELRRDPAVCARILFSIVTSSFHDPLGRPEQMSTREVVEVFLDGMRARLSPTTTAESSC